MLFGLLFVPLALFVLVGNAIYLGVMILMKITTSRFKQEDDPHLPQKNPHLNLQLEDRHLHLEDPHLQMEDPHLQQEYSSVTELPWLNEYFRMSVVDHGSHSYRRSWKSQYRRSWKLLSVSSFMQVTVLP